MQLPPSNRAWAVCIQHSRYMQLSGRSVARSLHLRWAFFLLKIHFSFFIFSDVLCAYLAIASAALPFATLLFSRTIAVVAACQQ